MRILKVTMPDSPDLKPSLALLIIIGRTLSPLISCFLQSIGFPFSGRSSQQEACRLGLNLGFHSSNDSLRPYPH